MFLRGFVIELHYFVGGVVDQNENIDLKKFLILQDEQYISISDLIDSIHKKVGLNEDISLAYQILNLAIGQSEDKPCIYKKDKFKGWQKGVMTHPHSRTFRAKAYVPESEKRFTIECALAEEQEKRLIDDLPF